MSCYIIVSDNEDVYPTNTKEQAIELATSFNRDYPAISPHRIFRIDFHLPVSTEIKYKV